MMHYWNISISASYRPQVTMCMYECVWVRGLLTRVPLQSHSNWHLTFVKLWMKIRNNHSAKEAEAIITENTCFLNQIKNEQLNITHTYTQMHMTIEEKQKTMAGTTKLCMYRNTSTARINSLFSIHWYIIYIYISDHSAIMKYYYDRMIFFLLWKPKQKIRTKTKNRTNLDDHTFVYLQTNKILYVNI